MCCVAVDWPFAVGGGRIGFVYTEVMEVIPVLSVMKCVLEARGVEILV